MTTATAAVNGGLTITRIPTCLTGKLIKLARTIDRPMAPVDYVSWTEQIAEFATSPAF